MAFDPSILSQIPSMGPNPVKAKEQAYTLANMADQTKLNKLTLEQAEQDRTDQAAIRDTIEKGDYSTPKGYWDTAAALTKAGHPQAAQDFMKLGSDVTTGKYTETVHNLDLESRRQDILAGAFDNVVGTLDAMRQANPNVSEDTLNAVARTLAIADAKRLISDHGDDPVIVQKAKQFLANPSAINYQSVVQLEKQTNLGQKLLAQRRADLQLGSTLRKNTADTEEAQARTRALQSGKLVPVQNEDGSVTYVPSSEASGKRVGTTGGRYGIKEPTSDAGKNLKDQFIEMVGGKVTLAQLRGMDFDELAKRGDTAASLEKRSLAIAGAQAEEGALGRREAGIESSAEEARNVIPIAIAASDAVPRGQFVPLTKLIQAGKIATSDPKLAAFAQANLTLANVYARAMSPTGTPTVEGREEALKKLSVATSPESYKAVVGIIQQEIDAARRAPGTISGDVLDRATGGTSANSAPLSSAPATAPAPVNAQGWRLMRDAQGNQAYVSPDGKQVQEIQ